MLQVIESVTVSLSASALQPCDVLSQTQHSLTSLICSSVYDLLFARPRSNSFTTTATCYLQQVYNKEILPALNHIESSAIQDLHITYLSPLPTRDSSPTNKSCLPRNLSTAPATRDQQVTQNHHVRQQRRQLLRTGTSLRPATKPRVEKDKALLELLALCKCSC